MAKDKAKDCQILIKMMQVQDRINDINDNDDEENVISQENKEALYTYYILNLYGLRKNLSGKTKKSIIIFNDKVADILNKSMTCCYPTLSYETIEKYALQLANKKAKELLKQQYEVCIKEANAKAETSKF